MKRFSLFSVILISFVLVSCSSMLEDFGKLTKHSNYRVEFYFERVYDSEFELDQNLTVTGELGQVDVENIREFKGFYYDSTKKETEDSFEIVKHYYRRNTVTLTLDPNGGLWVKDGDDKPKVFKGKYGQSIKQEWYNFELIKEDYETKGWDNIFLYFPPEDCESKAIWDQTYARYTVKQKIENIDSTYTETEYKLGGKPNEYTNVIPEEIYGYEPPAFSNVPIAADGSTVIELTYNRKLFTLTFKLGADDDVKQECKWNSKNWEDADKDNDYTVQVKYGNAIPEETLSYVNNPVRGKEVYADESANWKFAGWNKEYILPETVTGSETFVAQWAKPASTYIVRSKFEKPGKSGEIDETLTKEESYVGQVGEKTTVVAKQIPGYIADAIEQKEIDVSNDSTVVEVIYRLAEVTVIFNPNGGLWQDGNFAGKSEIFTIKGKYGESIKRPFGNAPTKNLNNFKGWSVSYSDESPDKEILVPIPNNTYIFGTCDATYTAIWELNGVYVIARFWQEDLSGNYDSGYNAGTGYNKELSQMFIVEPGKTTSLTPDISGEEFIGYEIADIQQIDIPETPDTDVLDKYIIKVKLARKTILYTFDANGGTWQNSWVDHGTAPAVKSGKYGTEVEIPKNEDLFRADYKFICWKDKTGEKTEIPTTFGFENRNFTAEWEKTGTKYKAQCWFKKLDGSGYEQDVENWPEKDETGSSLDKLNVKPPVIPGFNYVRYDGLLEGDMINPDGTTVLKLYYDRKEITYTFDANGGKFSNNEPLMSIKGLYGSTVNKASIEVPVIEGYDKFIGWKEKNTNSTTIPDVYGAENMTFIANWSIVPVTVITGVGTYTNKDIEMDATVSGTTVTVTVTIPYDGEWLFDVRDDNTSIEQSRINKVVEGSIVTFTFELPAGSGQHKLEVYAREKGTNVEKSKYKSVDVE